MWKPPLPEQVLVQLTVQLITERRGHSVLRHSRVCLISEPLPQQPSSFLQLLAAELPQRMRGPRRHVVGRRLHMHHLYGACFTCLRFLNGLCSGDQVLQIS